MRVYLKKDSKGNIKPRFQGAYELNGIRKVVTLNLWRGVPPSHPRGCGDDEYEISKREAFQRLLQIVENVKHSTPNKTEYEKLEELSARHKLATVYNQKENYSFDSILEKFKEYKLNLGITQHTANMAVTYLRKFFNFAKKTSTTLDGISPETVKNYIKILKNKYSQVTCNHALCAIKSCFKLFGPFTIAGKFIATIKIPKPTDVISHKIFNSEEIHNILALAKTVFPEVHDMIIVASCTGLRYKDIALLEWRSIDLERDLISLRTHKTGGEVTIGMWPILRNLLHTLKQSGKYVFPDAADAYLRNNTKTNQQRLFYILDQLGYETGLEYNAQTFIPEEVTNLDKIKIEAYLKTVSPAKRKAVKLFLEKTPIVEIAKACNRRCLDVLNFIRSTQYQTGIVIIKQTQTNKQRTCGKSNRARCVYGWHSFRGSFVVNSLKSGVSIEIIRKLLGSKVVDIIYQHYVKVDDEFMALGFTSKAPDFAKIKDE